MRSILANAQPALIAIALFSGYACTSDGGISVSGSGGHSQMASGGSGGSGGTTASGGVVAAGGAPATGGTTTSVPVGSGGIVLDSCSAGYPGNPFCGGTTGSAGATSSAGTTGSAGATGYGGMAGAGGTEGDASATTTGCSCAAGETTWDCYCRAFDCSKTAASYTADGGAQYDVRMEYANCNLVEYWTLGLVTRIDVFDLTTGQLVGQLQNNPGAKACPFAGAEVDAASYTTFSAGRVPSQHTPDSTCVRSKCSVTSSISDMCLSIDAGPRGE